MRFTLLAFAALALAAFCAQLAGNAERAEVFHIDWRDTDGAAAADGRPRLLFPRSALLDRSAAAALAHPVVADAAGSLFHAELTPGDVAAGIRFVSADGTDLAPSVPVDASVGPFLRGMGTALRAAGREVPEYVSLVAGELAPAERATARFAVTCHWKGEQKLGVLPGVVATRTGSLDGEEIIEVTFDPTRLDHAALAAKAREMSCFRKPIDAATLKPLDASNQQQYHLWLHKPWHFVPLTQLQATRVNAALVARESPDRFLSPTQLRIQRRLQGAYDRDHRSLDRLDTLEVSRTPEGIAAYAKQLIRELDSL